MKVIKRDGRAVDYDREKIKIAIEKANSEVKGRQKATKEEIKEMNKGTCKVELGTNLESKYLYEGDEFEEGYDYKTGTITVTKFAPKFENVDLSKIKGAFAVVIGEDGPVHTEVMNISQIKSAWNQGAAKGNSGAHKNFTDEMAKKTVINRACKNFVCTSDDSDILIESISRTNEYESEDKIESAIKEVHEEIKDNANQEVIDIPQEEVKEDVVEGQQGMFEGAPF